MHSAATWLTRQARLLQAMLDADACCGVRWCDRDDGDKVQRKQSLASIRVAIARQTYHGQRVLGAAPHASDSLLCGLIRYRIACVSCIGMAVYVTKRLLKRSSHGATAPGVKCALVRSVLELCTGSSCQSWTAIGRTQARSGHVDNSRHACACACRQAACRPPAAMPARPASGPQSHKHGRLSLRFHSGAPCACIAMDAACCYGFARIPRTLGIECECRQQCQCCVILSYDSCQVLQRTDICIHSSIRRATERGQMPRRCCALVYCTAQLAAATPTACTCRDARLC